MVIVHSFAVGWTAADVLGETIDAAGENQYF
jgi:hypothetical protein